MPQPWETTPGTVYGMPMSEWRERGGVPAPLDMRDPEVTQDFGVNDYYLMEQDIPEPLSELELRALSGDR